MLIRLLPCLRSLATPHTLALLFVCLLVSLNTMVCKKTLFNLEGANGRGMGGSTGERVRWSPATPGGNGAGQEDGKKRDSVAVVRSGGDKARMDMRMVVEGRVFGGVEEGGWHFQHTLRAHIYVYFLGGE